MTYDLDFQSSVRCDTAKYQGQGSVRLNARVKAYGRTDGQRLIALPTPLKRSVMKVRPRTITVRAVRRNLLMQSLTRVGSWTRGQARRHSAETCNERRRTTPNDRTVAARSSLMTALLMLLTRSHQNQTTPRISVADRRRRC